jgi:MoaA/NifB/PqqE/SkfB family radical SAM enzyme
MTDTSDRMYAIQSREGGEARRLSYMLEHMARNKAYLHAKEAAGGDCDGRLLADFRARFQWYRESWRELPRRAVQQKLTGDRFRDARIPPLCVDIEVAAVCDLACPFCYRQFIATPDKVMSDELSFRLIDEAADLGVPSMKFNWRGEPLLYPRLAELIAYAKKRGILETIINTNATCLTEETAAALIDAGLDLIIYSFDGGSKESYERMRPGRFKDNYFEDVYGNIRRFSEIRAAKGAVFPRTKIQMILTDETFAERDNFYALFDRYVDDVSVKQYTERGGKLSELDEATQQRLQSALIGRNLAPDTPFFRDKDGKLFVAAGRLPCEQPYQRLLVTYDGRAGMCCYDWGAQHPVGYADKLAIELGESEYSRIVERAKVGGKGFIQLKAVDMPSNYNTPAPVVHSLSEIWTGPEIDAVRAAHVAGRGGDIAICKACPFKETYRWEAIEE